MRQWTWSGYATKEGYRVRRIWGSGQEVGYSVAVDASGNVYLGGETHSASAIFQGSGFDDNLGGTQDGFVVKFNSGGQRQWGTYYGGNGNEFIYAIDVDGTGNVYATGKLSENELLETTAPKQIQKLGHTRTTTEGCNYMADAATLAPASSGERENRAEHQPPTAQPKLPLAYSLLQHQRTRLGPQPLTSRGTIRFQRRPGAGSLHHGPGTRFIHHRLTQQHTYNF